eukprot:1938212-Amphidinium_carterae.1
MGYEGLMGTPAVRDSLFFTFSSLVPAQPQQQRTQMKFASKSSEWFFNANLVGHVIHESLRNSIVVLLLTS